MINRKLIRLLLVTGVVLAFGSGAAVARGDQSARPLTGSFTGSGFDFQGEFSHLGHFTAHIAKFEEISPGTITEEWTAMAANGDTLRVSGVSSVTGFDSSTGLYTFSGTRTINGGTGRFSEATGTFEARGETAGDFSIYFGEVNGTISY
jgi:hypothetical protein